MRLMEIDGTLINPLRVFIASECEGNVAVRVSCSIDENPPLLRCSLGEFKREWEEAMKGESK